MTALKSVLIWSWIAFLTILLFFVELFLTILLFPFDPKRKVLHAQCYWWASGIINLNPFWTLSVNGLENIDKKKTYVIVANHQSLADIIVMYETRAQFKWVAKESLFSIPFIGWCLSLCKHIKLERGNLGSIKKVYRQAAEWLRKDMSVLFFPEGSRSKTGEMSDFQNGAFKLAIKERRPVLPILVVGTTLAIPKGSWIFTTKVHATLKVLEPIATEEFRPADFASLRDTVRDKLEDAARII